VRCVKKRYISLLVITLPKKLIKEKCMRYKLCQSAKKVLGYGVFEIKSTKV